MCCQVLDKRTVDVFVGSVLKQLSTAANLAVLRCNPQLHLACSKQSAITKVLSNRCIQRALSDYRLTLLLAPCCLPQVCVP